MRLCTVCTMNSTCRTKDDSSCRQYDTCSAMLMFVYYIYYVDLYNYIGTWAFASVWFVRGLLST